MEYKWTALSVVLISTMMGTINMSITLISLPAIFNGIHIDPLTSFQYLLWILMGYGLVIATLMLSFGRLSDIYGRAKFFKLGFLIFTIGSILLYITPSTGDLGAMELIIFRVVQATGSALFLANGAAILTDAFPHNELGRALGINMMFNNSGQFIGLILGGILAFFSWRYIFLVSIPFGIIGTFWSSLKLRELSIRSFETKIDYIGNSIFLGAILSILLGVTYGILPNGNDPMGWSDPWVQFAMILGVVLLIVFLWVETKVEAPMFKLKLFKIRMFAFGNLAGFLNSLARGGVMFMLILLLQGIWLPLHGYSYESTPLWAGIYMLPLTIGIGFMGPISGSLSDKYGPRWIATLGMVMAFSAFMILANLPYNFDYLVFGATLLLMGIGYGMFGSPNSSSIMGSVPPQQRGVASGMLITGVSTASVVSMGLFFSIVIIGITQRFPDAVTSALTSVGAAQLAPLMSNITPTGALFSAFLGYNPVESVLSTLPSAVVSMIPVSVKATLTGTTWFPNTLADAFIPSLSTAFYIMAGFTAIAAFLSALRGEKYVHGQGKSEEVKKENRK